MRLNIQQLAATPSVRAAIEALDRGQVKSPAWSLFLDKCSFERGGGDGEREDEPAKTRALHDVRELYNGESVRGELAAACDGKLRWLLALEEQAGKGRFCDVLLVNESRLLVHLGRVSVLENVGLCVERTTGLPWIPGTAVKGVLSTWALWEGYFGRNGTLGQIQMPPRPGGQPGESLPLTRAWVTANGPDRSDLASRVFGDDSPTGSKGAGGVIFVGGFPDSCPKLGLDIVNPHYDEERDQRTGRVISVHDKRNLTPNIFLAVEPGTVWHFVVYARLGVSAQADLLSETKRWLKDALINLGLGAKTAAGYGRFREPKPSQQKESDRHLSQLRVSARQEREVAVATPEDRPYRAFLATVQDWDALVRDIASLPAEHHPHVKRFFSTDDGAAKLRAWESRRAGRRQIQRLTEAGIL